MRKRFALFFILVGICLISIPFITVIQSTYRQNQLERQWEEAYLNQPIVEKPGPTQIILKVPKIQENGYKEPVARDTSPSVRLVIPRIGLEAIVVEGVTSASLKKGPGHFPGTAYPGQPGNCCIAAHRNMYGYWFSNIDKLDEGDYVILQTLNVDYWYRVTDKFAVLPDRLDVLYQTPESTLTLITCTPVPKPTHRLVVRAKLVE